MSEILDPTVQSASEIDTFTVKDVAKKAGLLRSQVIYLDSLGLVPSVRIDQRGRPVRVYTKEDIKLFRDAKALLDKGYKPSLAVTELTKREEPFTERQLQILQMRFGHPPMTEELIGQHLGISRQTVCEHLAVSIPKAVRNFLKRLVPPIDQSNQQTS